MAVRIAPKLRDAFPGLKVVSGRVDNVEVRPVDPELERLKEEISSRVRQSYSLSSLKDGETFRAYRDFFWRIGVDPTKTRPAAEALIRRILRGRPIPRINTLVDAYNVASVKTEVAIAAFDAAKLSGPLTLRFAVEGERFMGIGMPKPVTLKGGEVVISDGVKLVAVYPYRDSDDSKITERTRSALLIACGVPGISEERLRLAVEESLNLITKFCGGRKLLLP